MQDTAAATTELSALYQQSKQDMRAHASVNGRTELQASQEETLERGQQLFEEFEALHQHAMSQLQVRTSYSTCVPDFPQALGLWAPLCPSIERSHTSWETSSDWQIIRVSKPAGGRQPGEIQKDYQAQSYHVYN